MSKESDGKKQNEDVGTSKEPRSAADADALKAKQEKAPEGDPKPKSAKAVAKPEGPVEPPQAKGVVSKDKAADTRIKEESSAKKTTSEAEGSKAVPKKESEQHKGTAGPSSQTDKKVISNAQESAPAAAVSKSKTTKNEAEEDVAPKSDAKIEEKPTVVEDKRNTDETPSTTGERQKATKEETPVGTVLKQKAKTKNAAEATNLGSNEAQTEKALSQSWGDRKRSDQEPTPDLGTTKEELGPAPEPAYEGEGRRDLITSVQNILKPKGNFLTRDELIQASRELKRVIPYNYEAWRLHADILLDALKQLETRQIQPDENFKLLTIPLREDDIRDAAESALRQCAHYAESEEMRIKIVDEANSVRRLTWF